MTFSISARCADTGMMGITISSSSPCVGSRCMFARTKVGVMASQNVTDPRLGLLGLDLLAQGFQAPQMMKLITDQRPFIEYRQLAAVDADGHIAHFTGAKTLGQNAISEGDGCVAAGNLLADKGVPPAMVQVYTEAGSSKHIAERLVGALEAGLEAGGEEDTVHSAALLVVDRHAWPLVDLRVDWHDDAAIGALRDLWTRYEPEMQPYMTRALQPADAPSYGVKGDL